MTFLTDAERTTLASLSRLTFCNPFLEERIELERRVLGDAFVALDPVWHAQVDLLEENPNVERIYIVAEELADRLRQRLLDGARPRSADRDLYRELVLYVLYYRYQVRFLDALLRGPRDGKPAKVTFYADFARDLEHFLDIAGSGPLPFRSTEHLFAGFFQVRRAFHFIFRQIAGSSLPVARLRAQIWESIFTHDLRRHLRSLYDRMGDLTTLVIGPSGTGKDLVARAIGLSRFIPFDPATGRFVETYEESYYALNLSALSPTLIESELFGHRRGAFTGAVADRTGWLEICPPRGTVFLDEIGELDPEIQVKLLRVLETRTFQRLGETQDRPFRGKVVAATNRDLGGEMSAGRFRDDLYYRLCSDIVRAPSLAERLADSPGELSILVRFLAHRLIGEEEAEPLAREVEEWISRNLDPAYSWPGNVRELAQCVSNVLVRSRYEPLAAPEPHSLIAGLEADFSAAELPAEEILRRYCTLAYARAGSYQQAARRLGLDRRTVKARIDERLLAKLRS